MSDIQRIERMLGHCSPDQRQRIFRHLRSEFSIHPLETEWNTTAEIILEAIHRSGEMSQRMFRGLLAEAAFRVEVVEKLKGWRDTAPSGNRSYDFRLEDGSGPVRIQVKLQRSKAGRPMRAKEAGKTLFSEAMFVVETQKTRAGSDPKTGDSTRPYRFGEFDMLAVAMYPSTRRWDTFRYTVANWLMAKPGDPSKIYKFQPVAMAPNDDWTDDFSTAVLWFRSGIKKQIRAKQE